MKKKTFIENVLSKVFKHWVSTVIGALILLFTYMVWAGKITATDWMMIFSGIIGIYFTFFKKDDNKVMSKPQDYAGLKPDAYEKLPDTDSTT